MNLTAALHKRRRECIAQLLHFDWNELSDPGSMGVWPGAVKVLLAGALFAICMSAGYGFHIKSLQASLARAAAQELALRADLEARARLAAGVNTYRAQVMEMEARFNELLGQLPGHTEVPGLLDDITSTGAGTGLEFVSIQLQAEQAQEFYVELPINIAVTGSYHELGAFVSAVASLSRIVTLHDFTIAAGASRSELSMQIGAKTYRYSPGEH